MQARLFIGNLSWNTSDSDLSELVSAHADVLDATVISDRDTGRSRGFGFVTIEADNTADVIRILDGQDLDGRAIRVNEAEEKPGSSRIESRLGRTNRNLHERSCSSDARSLANRHVSARADLYPSQSIVR